MTRTRALATLLCLIGIPLLFAWAGDAPPKRVSPADAKAHVGENAIVCGKVVDTKSLYNSVSGFGTPIYFDLDQPEPNPVFYFIVFGPQVAATQPAEMQKTVDTYKGKRVCVTGKINSSPDGVAFILANNRSSIKVDTTAKQ